MAQYGTIMHVKVKPGQRDAFINHMKTFETNPPPGYLRTYVGRVDGNPDGVVGVVVFESEEAYKKNAASPEMHKRFEEYMRFLAAEPQWTDVHWESR
jgi:quinol monooxygenase YgiN